MSREEKSPTDGCSIVSKISFMPGPLSVVRLFPVDSGNSARNLENSAVNIEIRHSAFISPTLQVVRISVDVFEWSALDMGGNAHRIRRSAAIRQMIWGFGAS